MMVWYGESFHHTLAELSDCLRWEGGQQHAIVHTAVMQRSDAIGAIMDFFSCHACSL